MKTSERIVPAGRRTNHERRIYGRILRSKLKIVRKEMRYEKKP